MVKTGLEVFAACTVTLHVEVAGLMVTFLLITTFSVYVPSSTWITSPFEVCESFTAACMVLNDLRNTPETV